MPCTDNGVPYPPTKFEILTSKTPAMLCGILRALGPAQARAIILSVDEKEAGVSHLEINEWWAMHEQRDLERRAREFNEDQRKARRRAALDKLSPADIAALGLTEEDDG